MYHQARVTARNFLVTSFASALAASAFYPQPQRAAAHEAAAVMPASPPLVAHIEYTANNYPLVADGVKIQPKPITAELYQVDRETLGDRQPLVMVHGLKGEYWPQFRWDRLIKRFKDYPEFNRNYKIYLLRYDTSAFLEKTVPLFQKSLGQLRKESGGKRASIIALSLGGCLVEEAMRDSETSDSIKLVFTLGAPLHGSPLFTTDWLQYSIYKNFYQWWTRVDHSTSYRFYFNLNQNLVHDLRWDNCDGFLPEVGPFKSRLPLGPKGDLTLQNDGNPTLLATTRDPKIDKSKFITYAGYLTNPYMRPGLRKHIESAILSPVALVTWKVPSHLAREHPVLQMLNRDITRVLPTTNVDAKNQYLYPYALNDGITPVASALFLPEEVCRQSPLFTEADIAKISGQTDVRLARVFRNADHLTFIDGYRPRPYVLKHRLIQDQLNPKDGLRTIFDWILSDLMQFECVPNQLAREADQSRIKQ